MNLIYQHIRKTLAIYAAIILGITLGWILYTGKDVPPGGIMIISVFVAAIQWYFAKSTALDKPEGETKKEGA